MLEVLSGELGRTKNEAIAYSVAANASALLKINGKVNDLKEGSEEIMEILKNGSTIKKVEQVSTFTQKFN